ncbi:MAG: ABC transporter ATP-binding protein, partial [Pyramidobacter sp.]|nr:ABC transporter ATP-binding protein [Pyramidobacter sp.]
RYGPFTALEELSLELRRGELMTLLGPSGCGKTTTLRVAGGFIIPNEGRVLREGRDITALPPEKRPTSTVFQNYALFPHLNVGENVAYGLRVRGISRAERRKRAEEELERVGLSGYASAQVQDLSGGQQQRVALARSLILGPAVLLLDEPLSSLDTRLRLRMRAEIRELQKRVGITTLYVTHDQEEALSISDRISVMHDGRLVQTGMPREVYFSPSDDFVRDFIGDTFPFMLDGRHILLRPDQVVPGEGGRLAGHLVSREFLGASSQWTIEYQGQMLRALIPSRNEPDAEAGCEVRFDLILNEDDCGA